LFQLSLGCLKESYRFQEALNRHQAGVKGSDGLKGANFRNAKAKPVAVHIEGLPGQLEIGRDAFRGEAQDQAGRGDKREQSIARIAPPDRVNSHLLRLMKGRDKAVEGGVEGVPVIHGQFGSVHSKGQVYVNH
jgi:hypothetical protein